MRQQHVRLVIAVATDPAVTASYIRDVAWWHVGYRNCAA